MWSRFLEKPRPPTTQQTSHAIVPVIPTSTTTIPAPPVHTISVMDIYKKLEHKKLKRVASYEHVLKSCFDHIQKVADKEEYHTVFEVPLYVVGLPLYNMTQCIAYIICQLRKQGFFIRFVPRQYIYISWKLEDIHAPGAVPAVNNRVASSEAITDPNRPLQRQTAPPARKVAFPPPPPQPPIQKAIPEGYIGASSMPSFAMSADMFSDDMSSIPLPAPVRADTKTIQTDTLPVPRAPIRRNASSTSKGTKPGHDSMTKATPTVHGIQEERRIPFPPPLEYDPYDMLPMSSTTTSRVAPPLLLPQPPTKAEHAVKPSGKFILKLD